MTDTFTANIKDVSVELPLFMDMPFDAFLVMSTLDTTDRKSLKETFDVIKDVIPEWAQLTRKGTIKEILELIKEWTEYTEEVAGADLGKS